MRRWPEGARVMRARTPPARRCAYGLLVRPLPPCGGGLGRGVNKGHRRLPYPPLHLSPTKGERAEHHSRLHFVPCLANTSWLRRIIPQLEPLDLAGCGLRQGLDGLDPARIFPDADLLLDVLLQRLVQTLGRSVRAQ